MIGTPLRVVNVGLETFAAAIRTASPHTSVVHVDWRPPDDADPATAHLAARLLADARVDAANRDVLDRIRGVSPVAIGVRTASSCIPALAGSHTLLHAGPPIDWSSMCGPMRGALVGAVLFERWADDADAAHALLARGAVALLPCHDADAVGPMAGVLSPSMPVWVVEDPASGRRTCSHLNEGLGKVLRFGAHAPDVIDRLNWMATRLAPVLHDALTRLGGIALAPLMAQALTMGDEVHNRNVAATGQLLKRLAPVIASGVQPSDDLAAALAFVAGNDHFFLNLSMAACKAMLDAGHGVAGSSIVTAMARNGVEFGIRLSGTGQRWFTAPAKAIEGLYFPGYGPTDANPDLGDSAITETAGLGAFAMAAAPAIVGFVGGDVADAVAVTHRMRTITAGTNPAFTIPALGFMPTSLGIDARLVVDTGVLPVINTGIAHRDAGVGQIGAGITTAPWQCFRDALRALDAVAPSTTGRDRVPS